MNSLTNTSFDKTLDPTFHSLNPIVKMSKSMESFVDFQMTNLKQISSNFLMRYFEFRTKHRNNKLNVVQLMSEYDGNFSTPVCYLQFYLKRAGKFIRFAEEIGVLTGAEEINRLNCIRIYKDFIQRYSEFIGAIQNHENTCDGRLFRRSIERMQSEIAYVPINLHLQQLLVSNDDDPSQRSVYNIVTLGAPAVHHSRFTNGGLVRIKSNLNETNQRLCYFQDKLQDILVRNSDIEDALDHLTQIMENTTIQVENSVLKLSLQRVINAFVSLIENSSKNFQITPNSTGQVIINPLIAKNSIIDAHPSNIYLQEKVKNFLDEINQSMTKDEQIFDKTQLNQLRSLANELEHYTCKEFMRVIFQESMEIERHPQIFRERFDIAFCQALTCLIFSIYVLLATVKINDQARNLYINNGLLVLFEYLLTCDADELGMLEDSIEAIHALEHVRVRFVPVTTNHTLLQPRFFGTRFYCKVVIPLPVHIFNRLPKELKDGTSIPIVPIVFNVGIDHRASLARMFTLNLFTAAQAENNINYVNFDRLKAYVGRSLNNLPNDVPDLMKLLEHTICSNKPKNVDIFPLAEKICRRSHGIRVTGCKSAKDRTSMGFTLEQGQLLVNNHNVDKSDLQEVLNQFRRHGTSIENAFANTGSKAYAFSYIQLLTFPEFYRAQPGTYGNVET